MRKILYLALGLILFNSVGYAQKFISKNAHIRFFSSAPLEDIEANNYQVNVALDTENGDIVFKVLIKAFEFEKALMQEHFNENYMESDTYPNSIFKGKVTNIDDISFIEEGEYPTKVKGELTIHGVSNVVEIPGVFIRTESFIKILAVFQISLKDYNIKIPRAVTDNIASEVEISVNAEQKEL